MCPLGVCHEGSISVSFLVLDGCDLGIHTFAVSSEWNQPVCETQ